MNLKIESRIGVRASADVIWALIEDLAYWGRWNPVETNVSGAIAFGGKLSLTETIEGLGSRQVEASVAEWQPRAQLVWSEKRGWQFRAVRFFEIEELEPGSCIVTNGVILSGFRGESYHDKHKRAIKAAYADINEALKVQAEGG